MINPKRDVPDEAFKVHGFSKEFLSNKEIFENIAEDFLDFIRDKKIIIHNAKHKRTFCNIEFAIDLIFNISHKKKLTNKIFNIGSPEKEISIMELAQKIKKILNLVHVLQGTCKYECVMLRHIECTCKYGSSSQDATQCYTSRVLNLVHV